MSFVGDLFDSSKGAGFQATGANLQTPVSADQATQAGTTANNALAAQQAFLKALQAQGGIGNQSSVYNQLQGVANGTGPNPAVAELNQATGANTANQAALMAGQRGAGANAGLIARQAAQQGAANQQAAAGQAATLQANQSLNALNSLGNIANTQVSNQANALQNYNQGAQNEQGTLLNAVSNQNNAAVSNQANINNVNAGIAAGNQKAQQGLAGGILNGISSAVGAAAAAGGGEIVKMADGGTVPQGPQSKVGVYLFGQTKDGTPAPINIGTSPQDTGAQSIQDGTSNLIANSAKGIRGLMKGTPDLSQGVDGGGGGGLTTPSPVDTGAVATMYGAKGGYLLPKQAMDTGAKLKAGGAVPGKAKVTGNSYANDTVAARLSPGEIVLPRSVTQSRDPVGNAAKFVAAVMAKKKGLK